MNPQLNNNKLKITNIEADLSTEYLIKKNFFSNKLFPSIFVSIEKIFKLKNFNVDLKFISWLIYLSICEFEVKKKYSINEKELKDLFF